VLFLSLLFSCSEYDLRRGEEKNQFPLDEDAPFEPPQEPYVQVTPNPIDFGMILRDCPAAPIEVTVTNRGYSELDVLDIYLQGDGSSAFEHDGQPMTLAFDESASFELRFTPAYYIDYDVDLVVESNDPTKVKYPVEALGKGVAGAYYEESFQQRYYDKIDVLWVLDNSGSMSDAIDKLAVNFEHFITTFLGLNMDFRMGLVTTDMLDEAQSGRLQGRIITSDMSQAEAESIFLNTVNVGTEGDWNEKGIDAAHAALSEPLVSTANAGFLRSDAALSVIFVSDEDDASDLTPTDFIQFLQGLKADPNNVRVSGFVGLSQYSDPLVCNAEGVGYKYLDVISATGGVSAHVCTAEFEAAFNAVTISSAGLRASFLLEKEPVSESRITVFVDGQIVAQDSSNGWTYDAQNNVVILHGDAIPGDGSIIDIQYETPSTCE